MQDMETGPDARPAAKIPEAILKSSGRKIPLLGLSTYSSPPVEPGVIKSAVIESIKLGYRHFDTASLYKTEQPLGEAISEALSLGLIGSRDEVFVTSKLWCSNAHPGLVIPAIEKSLKNLKLEYMDLFLIHWPVSSKPGTLEYPIKKEDFLAMDFKGVWAEMEQCQRQGLTKSIGVSNFSCRKLVDILTIAEIPPAVNQVELNPFWQQKKLKEFCDAKGILLTAYGILRRKNKGNMEHGELKEIARARGKTVAQICLRWAYQQGVCVLAKSFNKERMKHNMDIFDWKLNDEELKMISKIQQSRGCPGLDYISEYGTFRTLEELWDE